MSNTKRFELKRGITREVILVWRYAFKVPSLRSWRMFLNGLLANMQEAQFGKQGWDGICPVVFSLPLGLLVVMPRCRPLSSGEFSTFDYERFVNREHYIIPAENKRCSFGFLGSHVVAVDYGT